MKPNITGELVYEIVHKLLGNIEPVGETNYDEQCLKNLDEYNTLIAMLLDDIQLLIPYQKRYQASMKKISDYALEFCRDLQERNDYWLHQLDEE